MSQNSFLVTAREIPKVLQPNPIDKNVLKPVPRDKTPEIEPDQTFKLSLIKIEEQKRDNLESNIYKATQKGNKIDIFV